jgi:hypothetical protein
VGAVSIDAKLDCDAFASTHSATSHYDRASFVGLAWRPGGESICCGACFACRVGFLLRSRRACACAEIYSTGKANLPGSTRQRDLLISFSRMVSELLRHSDRPEVCDLVPVHLRLCHRPRVVTRDDAPAVAQSFKANASPLRASVSDLFANDNADWLGLEPLGPVSIAEIAQADEEGILDMNGF